jgi:hypothetical protein
LHIQKIALIEIVRIVDRSTLNRQFSSLEERGIVVLKF